MTHWLSEHFSAASQLRADIDEAGNVFVTKGVSEIYPLVCAHTDTVHPPTNVVIEEDGDKIFATDWTATQVGVGGDDKAGIYICLQLLDRLPVLKAAFFASEEPGCLGAHRAKAPWFADVGYAIEFDSPCEDIMSFSSDGLRLFPTQGPFFEAISVLLNRFGVTRWQRHPYTDVSVLKRRFTFPCLNLPAGYYRMHSPEEYVQTSVVEKSTELGCELVKALACHRYFFKALIHGHEEAGLPVPVTGLEVHDWEPSVARRCPLPVDHQTIVDRVKRLQ